MLLQFGLQRVARCRVAEETHAGKKLRVTQTLSGLWPTAAYLEARVSACGVRPDTPL